MSVSPPMMLLWPLFDVCAVWLSWLDVTVPTPCCAVPCLLPPVQELMVSGQWSIEHSFDDFRLVLGDSMM